MINSQSDEGLKALRKVFEEMNTSLPEELVVSCYNIQKKFQFSEDRSLSLDATKEIVMSVIKEERVVETK